MLLILSCVFEFLLKSGVCMCVRLSLLAKMLTSPPVLKLLDSQGYLWLTYDLAKVIKLIGETFEQFIF